MRALATVRISTPSITASTAGGAPGTPPPGKRGGRHPGGGGGRGEPPGRVIRGGAPGGGGGARTPPPAATGGALRSLSLLRPAGQPVVLNGTIIRVDPATGAALPDNPLAGSADANARRIV